MRCSLGLLCLFIGKSLLDGLSHSQQLDLCLLLGRVSL